MFQSPPGDPDRQPGLRITALELLPSSCPSPLNYGSWKDGIIITTASIEVRYINNYLLNINSVESLRIEN